LHEWVIAQGGSAILLARSFAPQQNRTLISTEAAHAFVSSAVEKSASFPTPPSRDISHYIKGTHLIIPKSADRPLS
jgi:hypothetical protein